MTHSAILCVDDEPLILASLKEQLRRLFGQRYLYETASNVQEAWEVVDELYQDEIDILIIVSDWLMPGVKGDAFLIDVHKRYPQIVTIMLTGQADEDAIERARRDGNLHACISKPWNEAQLGEIISSALR